MKTVFFLHEVDDRNRARVGGKGYALSRMVKEGIDVPEALCISIDAYHAYVDATGLRDRIMMELHRKPFEDMRWEEMWDTALRIRNLFAMTEIPDDLREMIAQALDGLFRDVPVSVRSSAPGEDAQNTSFAGLHESYIHLIGIPDILEHVRLVWASLWSDRALLYRRELGLDTEKSAMAVVVQKMAFGDRSGIVFGVNPLDDSQGIVEAVYGLNQALVDGTVQPDRWTINRQTMEIIDHTQAGRDQHLIPDGRGTRLSPLPPDLKQTPPLQDREVNTVYTLAMQAESIFGSPQDVEWTYARKRLVALQSRPITTTDKDENDERRWYLSLHRSFDNLKDLRIRIENELIPAMAAEADEMARMPLEGLSDDRLAKEIDTRLETHKKWQAAYRRDCIPFAHGMRLFGQIYNDVMKPTDPFEFMDILSGAGLLSVQRNRMMARLAAMLHQDPLLKDCVENDRMDDCQPEFLRLLDEFYDRFGDLTWGKSRMGRDPHQLLTLLLQWTAPGLDRVQKHPDDASSREADFIARFRESGGVDAAELIDLARASYRFRDDDNTYLGRIEGQLRAAVEEGKNRIRKRTAAPVPDLEAGRVAEALRGNLELQGLQEPSAGVSPDPDFDMRPRQLLGQPSGTGIAVGTARVVTEASDLFAFKTGEVLVCDAVDPNMTFVVPLASGIVERRGGMLIHGAIIAREYGIPCVTGVADAANLIRTGETVTVDGFLGMVIIGEHDLIPDDREEREVRGKEKRR